MTHQVRVKDFMGCIASTTLCSSYGKNTGNKELNAYCIIPDSTIRYEVRSFNEVIYDGSDIIVAVDEYNGISG